MQTTKIGELSDGQQSRLVFAMICMKNPNLLLLDEPTNHLDIEAIDSLAEAIKGFKGGLVLVSHDFRLIDQVRPHANMQQRFCIRGGVDCVGTLYAAHASASWRLACYLDRLCASSACFDLQVAWPLSSALVIFVWQPNS